MAWLKAQKTITLLILAAELVLFLLPLSLYLSRASAFDPSVSLAHPGIQSPATEQKPSESLSESKLESLVGQAQQAQNSGDYQRAAALYQEVLKLRPHFAEARANLGLMYHLLGDYPQAVGQFELALRDEPEMAVPNLFLGLDLLALHEPQKAIGYLHRAQRLNPHDEPTALGLGRAYAALREFQRANDWYFRATEINPKDSEALYGLGITYLDLQRSAARDLGSKGQDSLYSKRLLGEFFEQEGRVNDAINLYKKLLEANTTWPGLRTALGFDYLLQAKVVDAKAEFQADLDRNPDFLLARLGIARTSLEQADTELCAQDLGTIWKIDRPFLRANADAFLAGMAPEKARSLEEHLVNGTVAQDLRSYLAGRLQEIIQGQPHAFPNAASVEAQMPDQAALQQHTSPADLYRQGRYSACAQKLKAEGGSDRRLLLLLAQCGYDSGDFRASFVAAGKMLRTNPADLAALYWRAASSSKLAIRTLYDAGVADPNSYRVHLLLGETYRMMKKSEKSEQEYRRALELKPNDAAVRLGLATLYWQTKEYDKAVPELRDVLAGRPQDPEASYLMGDILVSRHQYSQAGPYLAAALHAAGSTAYYAHALRGKILASEDRTEEAIKELQLALPGDDDGSFHFQIYRLYVKAGNQAAAATALRDSEAIRQRQADSLQAAFARSE
jgi:tetratricopeptide (TPR) repeat protein